MLVEIVPIDGLQRPQLPFRGRQNLIVGYQPLLRCTQSVVSGAGRLDFRLAVQRHLADLPDKRDSGVDGANLLVGQIVGADALPAVDCHQIHLHLNGSAPVPRAQRQIRSACIYRFIVSPILYSYKPGQHQEDEGNHHGQAQQIQHIHGVGQAELIVREGEMMNILNQTVVR